MYAMALHVFWPSTSCPSFRILHFFLLKLRRSRKGGHPARVSSVEDSNSRLRRTLSVPLARVLSDACAGVLTRQLPFVQQQASGHNYIELSAAPDGSLLLRRRLGCESRNLGAPAKVFMQICVFRTNINSDSLRRKGDLHPEAGQEASSSVRPTRASLGRCDDGSKSRSLRTLNRQQLACMRNTIISERRMLHRRC